MEINGVSDVEVIINWSIQREIYPRPLLCIGFGGDHSGDDLVHFQIFGHTKSTVEPALDIEIASGVPELDLIISTKTAQLVGIEWLIGSHYLTELEFTDVGLPTKYGSPIFNLDGSTRIRKVLAPLESHVVVNSFVVKWKSIDKHVSMIKCGQGLEFWLDGNNCLMGFSIAGIGREITAIDREF